MIISTLPLSDREKTVSKWECIKLEKGDSTRYRSVYTLKGKQVASHWKTCTRPDSLGRAATLACAVAITGPYASPHKYSDPGDKD